MQENTKKLEQNLEGQVAIVTGGGRNIGRAIAQELARAGMKVVVISRTAEEIGETVRLIQQEGGEATAFQVDVTERESVESMVQKSEQQFGPIELLVNNAAGLASYGPVWHEDSDVDVWWREVEINLRGPFLCSRAVLPSMMRRQTGRIIQVGSGIGAIKFANFSAYAASKAGLIKFAENLAEEVKEFGIKVFTIDPGLVRTAGHERNIESGLDDKWFGGIVQKWFAAGVAVPPTVAALLVRRIATGEVDALSGCYLRYDDDLTAMVANAQEIKDKELYTLRLRYPG